jgi:predicted branched-subunit amino acid permease
MASLCIAIYGMFLAIIIPPAKKSKPVLIVVVVAAILHCLFYYLPLLNQIPSGISISISAILAAIFGALLFPIKHGQEEAQND